MKRATLILAALALLLGGVRQALADFIMDVNPGGVMFFNDMANNNVDQFFGNIGGQNSGPLVTVTTVGNVDTGVGFSNITPVKGQEGKGGALTSLTFTPADPTLFNGFSFRGQLENDANGTVTLTVQDNQGNPSQPFTFTGLGATDFARIGIISNDGETIKSITLTSDFIEEKQQEFSYAPGVSAVPEPSTLTLLGIGLAAIAVHEWLRRNQAAAELWRKQQLPEAPSNGVSTTLTLVLNSRESAARR